MIKCGRGLFGINFGHLLLAGGLIAGVLVAGTGGSTTEALDAGVRLDLTTLLGPADSSDRESTTRDVAADWENVIDQLAERPKLTADAIEDFAAPIELHSDGAVALDLDGVEVQYETKSITFDIIPVVDEQAHILRHVETISLRGESKSGDQLLLSFLNAEGQGWTLSGGNVFPVGKRAWVVRPDFASRSVEISEVVDDAPSPKDPQSEDEVGAPGSRTPDDMSISTNASLSAGNARIDTLGVGLIETGSVGSDRLTSDAAVAAYVAGRNVFNLTMDNSSSSNWTISGVTMKIVGVMMVERAQTVSSTDLDYVKTDIQLQLIASALGADVISGVRVKKWTESGKQICGRSPNPGYAHVFSLHSTCTYSLVHETGHNLDANHSDGHTSGSVRSMQWDSSTSGTNRVMHFSNPDVPFPGPHGPSGTTTRNSAAKIAARAPITAGNRQPPGPSNGHYTPLSKPVRLLDTRFGVGGSNLPFAANEKRQVSAIIASLPPSTREIVVNVTAIPQNSSSGFVQARAYSSIPALMPPLVNYEGGRTTGATTVVRLSQLKTMYLRPLTSTHLVVDVFGYFGSGNSRLFELQDPQRIQNPVTIPAKTDITVSLGSSCPNSQSTTAAVVNITTVNPSGSGYVQAKRVQSDPDGAWSNVNYSGGDVVGNLAFVPVSGNTFALYSHATTTVVVDLVGCFSTQGGGRKYVSLSMPIRRLDTRDAGGPSALGYSAFVDTYVGGGDYNVALMKLTADNGSSGTHFVGYSTWRPLPPTSSVNVAPYAVAGNHTIARSGGNEMVRVRRGPSPGVTDLVVDVFGYFTP